MKRVLVRFAYGCRRILTVALSLALIHVGVPYSTAAAPSFLGSSVEPTLYFRSGGELFVIDFGEFLEKRVAVASGNGSFSVTMRRLVGDEGPSSRQASLEMRLVGTEPGVAGADSELPGRSEDWLTWSVESTPQGTTSSYRAGQDTFSVSVPRLFVSTGLAGVPDQARFRISVNDVAVQLDGKTVNEILPAVNGGPENLGPGPRQALGKISSAFRDPAGFLRAFLDFQLAAVETSRAMPLAGEGCVGPCMGCVGSLGLSIASYLSIIATCVGAVPSGGGTFLACVAALVGFNSTSMMLVVNCALCLECAVEEPPCPCEGQPGCDCPS